jgi:hypothetical protein
MLGGISISMKRQTYDFGGCIKEKARPSDKEHEGYSCWHTLNVELDLFQWDLIALRFFWLTFRVLSDVPKYLKI